MCKESLSHNHLADKSQSPFVHCLFRAKTATHTNRAPATSGPIIPRPTSAGVNIFSASPTNMACKVAKAAVTNEIMKRATESFSDLHEKVQATHCIPNECDNSDQ